jgi:hypothetical protein
MKKFLALFGLAAIAAFLFKGGKKNRRLDGSFENRQLGWGEAPANTDFSFTIGHGA